MTNLVTNLLGAKVRLSMPGKPYDARAGRIAAVWLGANGPVIVIQHTVELKDGRLVDVGSGEMIVEQHVKEKT